MMENVEGVEKNEAPRRKIDVKRALSVIPPASQLYGEKRRVRERRIRLRFHNELKENIALLNPELAKELEISDKVEIVVAHRHRFVYAVQLSEDVPVNEVWVNGEKLPEYGVSDNTIATVRAHRG